MRNKYAGIKAAGSRTPQAPEGEFVVQIENCAERFNEGTKNETIHVNYTVVQADEEKLVGRKYVMIFMASGKGMDQGLGRFKSLLMAAAGYVDEESFDKYNGEEGEFTQAALGYSNDRSEDDLLPAGRILHLSVTRGNDTKDGRDWYREYSFTAIDQETGEPLEA